MTVFLVYFKYLKNYIGGKMSSPQIQNALQTVNRLVPLVEDAERHFKSARNWSFLDVLGGGFLTDLVKYHKLNKASDSMNEINYLMQNFSSHLLQTRSLSHGPHVRHRKSVLLPPCQGPH